MVSKAKKSKSKSRKKGTKKAVRQKPGLIRRLFRLLMLLLGLGIGIGAPWVVWLDMQVRGEFEGRVWDIPSRVYARPLSLYSGKPISKNTLQLELKASGYREMAKASGPGTYTVSGNSFDINRRSFVFEDGSEPANRFRLQLSGGAIKSMSTVSGSEDPDWYGWTPLKLPLSTLCTMKIAPWWR